MRLIRFGGKGGEGEIWIAEDQIVAVSSTVRGSRIHAGGRVFEVAESVPVVLARLGVLQGAQAPGSFADPSDRE